MSEKPKENLIEDTKDPFEKKRRSGFEMPQSPSEGIAQGLTSLNNLINHDEPITQNSLEKISESLDNLVRDSGLEENMSIWNEIIKGNFDEEKIKKLTILTEEVAELIMKNNFGWCLVGVTSISEGVAKVLSQHSETLNLDGLTSISDPVAFYLTQHKGSLSLKGLQSLSDNAAKYFFDNSKYIWWFEDLTSISDEGIKYIVENQSRRKDKYGMLALRSLSKISDEAFKTLSEFKGDSISVGVSTLTEQSAKNISQFKGRSLGFNEITDLPDEIAEQLSNFKGSISLRNLKTLSPEAVKALSNNPRSLNLQSITSLSEEAVKYLSRINDGSTLTLKLLNSITDEMAQAFSHHKGLLDLGVESLSGTSAEYLSKHQGSVYLTNLKTLSDEAAEGLSHSDSEICINEYVSISPKAKEILSTNEKIKYSRYGAAMW